MNTNILECRLFEADCEFESSKFALEKSIDQKYDNIKNSIVWGFISQAAKEEQLKEIEKLWTQEKLKEIEKLKVFIEKKYFGNIDRKYFERSLNSQLPQSKSISSKLFAWCLLRVRKPDK